MFTTAALLAIFNDLQTVQAGRLAKGGELDSDTLHASQFVKEDLETIAHNTLWEENDEGVLSFLKVLPTTPAMQREHQYEVLLSFGAKRGTSRMTERTLPGMSTPEGERRSTRLQLMGERDSTFLLAGMENTVAVMGTQDKAAWNQMAARLRLLWNMQKSILFSETTRTRQGANGPRYKGIAQLIREGTDGTTGTSPLGESHSVDLEGLPLTWSTLRTKMGQGKLVWGVASDLFLAPTAREDLEATIDEFYRLGLPAGSAPMRLGQHVNGFQSGGNKVWFSDDTMLDPLHRHGRYEGNADNLEEGYPTGLVTGTATAAPGSGSKWDASSIGEIFYVVAPVKDEKEGLGTRIPSGSSTLTVAAGDVVTLTITPADALTDSYIVYRGKDDWGTDATDAWFAFEYAGDGTGAAITILDKNERRPRTTEAFMLNIRTAASQALHTEGGYNHARANYTDYLGMPDDPVRNTVSIATLGPRMGRMDLARLLPTITNGLIFTAHAPMVRNPFQNWHFYNIGRA